MRTIEAKPAKPIQLGFGETVIAERKVVIGTIKPNVFVVAPDKGRYYNARLTQDTECEQLAGQKVRGLSAWQVPAKTCFKRNQNGHWREWSVPEVSVIGVYAENIRSRRIESKTVTEKAPLL